MTKDASCIPKPGAVIADIIIIIEFVKALYRAQSLRIKGLKSIKWNFEEVN